MMLHGMEQVQEAVASFDLAEHQRQKEIALKKELEDKNKRLQGKK